MEEVLKQPEINQEVKIDIIKLDFKRLVKEQIKDKISPKLARKFSFNDYLTQRVNNNERPCVTS